LVTHWFDVVKWDWGTKDKPKKFIDIINGICKEYDHDTRLIKPFEILNPLNLSGTKQSDNLILE
jgi:hypothetical protein